MNMKPNKKVRVESFKQAEKRIKSKITRLISKGKYKEALESIFGRWSEYENDNDQRRDS